MPSFFIGFIVLSEDRMNAIMEFRMIDNIINDPNWEVLWKQVRTILTELLHLAAAQRFHAKTRVILSSFLCVARWHYIIGVSPRLDHRQGSSWEQKEKDLRRRNKEEKLTKKTEELRGIWKKEQLKKRSSPKKIYELKAFRCNIREWIGSWKKLWTNGVCGVCLETTATFQSIMSETLRLAKRFIKLTKGIKGSVRTINQFD